jgi:hypothetical protein
MDAEASFSVRFFDQDRLLTLITTQGKFSEEFFYPVLSEICDPSLVVSVTSDVL